MRLGACPAMLDEGSVVAELYGTTVVSERHRHRYEFNSRYREQFEAAGMRCSGTSPDGRLVEFVEIARAPVLRRHPGPPGVQVAPGPPAPAVPRPHQGGRRARRGPRTAHHRSRHRSTPRCERRRSASWRPTPLLASHVFDVERRTSSTTASDLRTRRRHAPGGRRHPRDQRPRRDRPHPPVPRAVRRRCARRSPRAPSTSRARTRSSRPSASCARSSGCEADDVDAARARS